MWGYEGEIQIISRNPNAKDIVFGRPNNHCNIHLRIAIADRMAYN
jgi:hypothetical protein